MTPKGVKEATKNNLIKSNVWAGMEAWVVKNWTEIYTDNYSRVDRLASYSLVMGNGRFVTLVIVYKTNVSVYVYDMNDSEHEFVNTSITPIDNKIINATSTIRYSVDVTMVYDPYTIIIQARNAKNNGFVINHIIKLDNDGKITDSDISVIGSSNIWVHSVIDNPYLYIDNVTNSDYIYSAGIDMNSSGDYPNIIEFKKSTNTMRIYKVQDIIDTSFYYVMNQVLTTKDGCLVTIYPFSGNNYLTVYLKRSGEGTFERHNVLTKTGYNGNHPSTSDMLRYAIVDSRLDKNRVIYQVTTSSDVVTFYEVDLDTYQESEIKSYTHSTDGIPDFQMYNGLLIDGLRFYSIGCVINTRDQLNIRRDVFDILYMSNSVSAGINVTSSGGLHKVNDYYVYETQLRNDNDSCLSNVFGKVKFVKFHPAIELNSQPEF